MRLMFFFLPFSRALFRVLGPISCACVAAVLPQLCRKKLQIHIYCHTAFYISGFFLSWGTGFTTSIAFATGLSLFLFAPNLTINYCRNIMFFKLLYEPRMLANMTADVFYCLSCSFSGGVSRGHHCSPQAT